MAAGSPAPNTWLAGLYTYPWSPGIGLVEDASTGYGYPITYEYWIDEGSPTPQTVSHVNGEVVWKKRDSSTLYLDSAITGDGFALTHDQWTALGRPAPVTRR